APASSKTERKRTAPSPTQTVPGSSSSSSGRTAAGRPPRRTNTCRRWASITGNAPGSPAARASSVETPATGSSHASASPRAAASPIRKPVKLPGPVPTASASRSAGPSPCPRRIRSAAARTSTARHVASPSGSPSRTSAVVATEVAVSSARISTEDAFEQAWFRALQHDKSTGGVEVPEARRHPCRREPARARLGPLDEADRVLEVRLQRAPFRRVDPLEAVEVEVAHAPVAVPDRVRRTRHGPVDAERAGGPADERRLARAELARDRHDVAGLEARGEAGGDALRLGGRLGGQLDSRHPVRMT